MDFFSQFLDQLGLFKTIVLLGCLLAVAALSKDLVKNGAGLRFNRLLSQVLVAGLFNSHVFRFNKIIIPLAVTLCYFVHYFLVRLGWVLYTVFKDLRASPRFRVDFALIYGRWLWCGQHRQQSIKVRLFVQVREWDVRLVAFYYIRFKLI
jgi:hypothetical protein